MANTIKPSAGNPIKVLNSSLEGITVTDDGNVQVKLGDDAGSKKLSVRDSGDVEVAYIDSDGVISGASGELPTAVRGSVLIGDATPEWAVLDASADTKILVGNGTTLASVALSGDVTMTNAGAVTIANDAVTLAKLANVTRGSLIVGGASDAPTLLSGKTLGAILIGDGTDITSTVNPSIAGNVVIGGTLIVNTDNLIVNSTGLGVGKTPSAPLHVVNNAIVQTGTTLSTGVTAVFEDENGGMDFLATEAGTYGAFFTLKEINSASHTLVDAWGILRQTTGGTGDGSLAVSYGTGANPWVNTVVITATTDGEIGIGETTIPTGALLAVGGGISVTDGGGNEEASLNNDISIIPAMRSVYLSTLSSGGGFVETDLPGTTGGFGVVLLSLSDNDTIMIRYTVAGGCYELFSSSSKFVLFVNTDIEFAGTDSKINISVYNQKLQIRNRTTGTKYPIITFLASK